MSLVPDSILTALGGVGFFLSVSLLARTTLTDRRAAWWCAGTAAFGSLLAALLVGPRASAALAVVGLSLLARAGAVRSWASALGGVLALLAVWLSPPLGIVAIALSAWRSRASWQPPVEALAAAALVIAIRPEDAVRPLAILAVATALAWLVTHHSRPIGSIPDARATAGLARLGVAVGIFALLFADEPLGLLGPDEFWRAILYAALAGAAGAVASLALIGARTLMAVRDDARTLGLALTVTGVLVLLLSLRAGLAAFAIAGVLAQGVGFARAQAILVRRLRSGGITLALGGALRR